MMIFNLWRSGNNDRSNNDDGKPDASAYGTDEGSLLAVDGDRALFEEIVGALPNPSPRAGHAQAYTLSPQVALDLRDVAQGIGHRAEVLRQSSPDDEPQIIDDEAAPVVVGDSPTEYDANMAATSDRPGASDGRRAYLAGIIPPALEAHWLLRGAIPQAERPCVVLCELGDFDPAPYAADEVRRKLASVPPLRLRYGARGAWGPDLAALAQTFLARPIGAVQYDPIPDAGDLLVFVVELRGVPEPVQIPLKV